MTTLFPLEPPELPKTVTVKFLGIEIKVHPWGADDVLIMSSPVDSVMCDLRTGELYRLAPRRNG